MMADRKKSMLCFGLFGDEPFCAPIGGPTVGIREAYARGLVSDDALSAAYPSWDKTISPQEAKILEMDIIDLMGEVVLPGVSDWSARVTVRNLQ